MENRLSTVAKFYSNTFLFHRVILRKPYIGKNLITRSQYKQMIGRAGRAGIDTSGESIMLIDKRDKDKVRVNISHLTVIYHGYLNAKNQSIET